MTLRPKRARLRLSAPAAAFAVVIAGAAAADDPPPQPIPIDQRPACTAPDVVTGAGTVCGLSLEARAADGSGERTVNAYLGIPFAESTVGENRWASPVAVAAYDGVLRATAFGPICPQTEPSPKKSPQSEDCLSVNVWAPADASGPLPVMAFIYGGSFIDGSSSLPIYDGAALAASGRAIVVSFNYRVGALGFLAGVAGLSGNYGFLDQQLALRWVADNIAGFGGDPARVTLFGQSAGAMSVGLHLFAPGSQGLFRAAIMESNPYGMPYRRLAAAGDLTESLRLELGCVFDTLACLHRQSAAAIVAAQSSAALGINQIVAGFGGQLAWAPVVDGTVIAGQPLDTPIALPVLIGTNRNEGTLFAAGQQVSLFGTTEVLRLQYDALIELYFPATARAAIRNLPRYQPRSGDNTEALSNLLTDYLFTCPNRLAMRRAAAPVYGYAFTHVPSYDVWPEIAACAPSEDQVCHSFELPFVFGNPTTVTRQLTPPDDRFTAAEQRLSETMADAWLRFAETLDPNAEGSSDWPVYSAGGAVRVLDTTAAPDFAADAHCDVWDSVGYTLPGVLARVTGVSRGE
ncbi:carboxylesterase/lipase family protein [Bauldia sp.]|uniref:carboxylesterase/lipase family protein n=1 Tax=Bauldia sp. TaxID=2575872 RepID=UPI003BA97817